MPGTTITDPLTGVSSTTPTDYTATNSFVTRAADSTDADGNTVTGAVTNLTEFYFENFLIMSAPSIVRILPKKSDSYTCTSWYGDCTVLSSEETR